MTTANKFVVPKSMAACADLLYKTREHRLALQQECDALEAQESALREHFINNLPKSDATGIAGKVARVTIVMKTVPKVESWDLLHGFIVKTANKNPGVWSLMGKTLGKAAVGELWKAGKVIPGVVPLNVPTVSLNKV